MRTHLGLDETAAYRQLIEKYNTLWRDSTMALVDYIPVDEKIQLNLYRPDRIMFGLQKK